MSASPSPQSKVVLITGASSGLGEATALACVRSGHRVALAARRVDRLNEIAARIDRPNDTLVIPADMRDRESIQRMATAAEEHFGRVDALVANAGVGYWGPFTEDTEERMLHQMEVNLFGVVRSARAVLPGMLQRGSGHILTISSVAGDVASSNGVMYAMSKAGVTSFSDGLRRELLPTGVKVTTIIPGFIHTEMTSHHNIPMPPASVIGDAVVRLLKRPQARVVLPRHYGAMIWLNRLAPWLIDIGSPRFQEMLERRSRRDTL